MLKITIYLILVNVKIKAMEKFNLQKSQSILLFTLFTASIEVLAKIYYYFAILLFFFLNIDLYFMI